MSLSSGPSRNDQEAASEVTVSTGTASSTPTSFLSEVLFRRMLSRERKRSERSRKHLLLMLIDYKQPAHRRSDVDLSQRLPEVLCTAIRDTDLAGWYETNSVFGVIFTELGAAEVQAAARIVETKVRTALHQNFKAKQLGHFQISFFAFPEGSACGGDQKPADPTLYPDLLDRRRRKRLSLLIKRSMDLIGSVVALVFLSPVFLVLTALIKLTSHGPTYFRQERVGQYGVTFTFLKFRSMHVSTDATIHQEYMKNYIAGKPERASSETNQETIYKIKDDPRVTWIGKFMRRTSLDEIPQFWNVLRGEMSLVGPRPPIPYEIEVYDVWHRQRLLEAKPGITGLWQVYGRSKTTFDEMVRLDLRYSRTWSPMLDVKILLQTPRAVIFGGGAY